MQSARAVFFDARQRVHSSLTETPRRFTFVSHIGQRRRRHSASLAPLV
jgi:hypothetical protein